MLGTNDCKTVFGASAEVIGKGIARLLDQIAAYAPEKVVEKAAMGYLYTKNLLTAYNKSMKNLNVADFNGLNWSSWEWDKE